MSAPVVTSATFSPSTSQLTVVWDQAVTWTITGGAGAIHYQRDATNQHANTTFPVLGDGTATHVFAMVATTFTAIAGGLVNIDAASVNLTASPFTANAAVANQPVTLSGGALVSLSDVKAQLGITDTSSDSLLTTMIGAAERMLALWCDRRDESSGMSSGNAVSMWISGTHVEKRPGALVECITARYWPVTSLTSIVVYSSGQSSYTLGTYLFRLDDNQKTIRFMGQQAIAWDAGLIPADFPFNVAPIQTERAYPYTQLTYVGGFTGGSVPPDLTQAAMELVKFIFNSRAIDWTLQGENFGDYSYTNFEGMMAQYRDQITTMYLSNYLGIGGGVV